MSSRTLYLLGAAVFAFSGLANLAVEALPAEAGGPEALLNFLGGAAGLLGLTAVYLWQRAESGVLGGVGYGLAAAGAAGIVGFLFADGFVLRYLDPQVESELMAGATGTAVFVSVLLYVLGNLIFWIATIRAGVLPRGAAVLVALGTLGILTSEFAAAAVVSIAETVASIGILWLSVALWRGAARLGSP